MGHDADGVCQADGDDGQDVEQIVGRQDTVKSDFGQNKMESEIARLCQFLQISSLRLLKEPYLFESAQKAMLNQKEINFHKDDQQSEGITIAMIRTLLTNSNVAVILMHRFSQQTVDGFVTWIEQKQVVLIVGRDVYADDARLASDNEIDDSALRVEEL